uniref:F-box domain-containing protein n=1 Tax=Strongyloides venezuelensis TaxID=75913 RepID=A0A0K0FD21_STRVS
MSYNDLVIFCFTEPTISRNIFKYISSYEDIINLSSSCKFFKNLLNLTPKNMVSYNENCFYEISLDRHPETNRLYVTCYNPFSRTKRSSYLFEDEITYLSTLSNNYFTFQSEITTEVDIEFGNISTYFANEIIDKLGEFINELSKLFKNAKILNLSLSLSLTDTGYDYLGRLLLQLKSDTIETIKFSVQDLFQIIPQNSILGNLTLFDGLPRFKEIYVSGFLSIQYQYRFNVTDSILTHFIRCLGNRKRCILNFSELNYSYIHQEAIAEYMELATSYDFYIQYKDEFDFPSTTYIPLPDREPFSRSNIFNNITSISIKIRTSQLFYPIVKGIKRLVKLKEIHVTMLNINISNISNVSWKDIKSLQLFNLDFCLSEEVHPIIAKNADYSDQLEVIRYFASVLPSSVTKLRLHNIYCITNDVSKYVSELLPNIQFLWIQCGIFENNKCLENFKNIKYLIFLNVQDVIIPKSVELFIMEQKWVIANPEDVRQIFKQYSETFSYLILQKPSLSRIYFNNLYKSKEFFKIIHYYHTNNPPSRFSKIPRF